MKHLGDITKIKLTPDDIVDCVSFGSPCQDLSVAGKRAGLEGERSGLFMDAIRVIKEMRKLDAEVNLRTDDDVRCRFAIWENVPGAFSSNSGDDFRVVLEELCRVKDRNATVPRPLDKKGNQQKWNKYGCIVGAGFSLAWRTFDAQYWGTPQRRKRIAVLADFNGNLAGELLLCDDFQSNGRTDSSSGESPIVGVGRECRREISLECEGLPRNFESCIETWQGIAEDPQGSIGECSRDGELKDYTLKVRGGVSTDSQGKQAGKGALIQTDLSATLGVSQDQTLFK